jgi:hypothetical protein
VKSSRDCSLQLMRGMLLKKVVDRRTQTEWLEKKTTHEPRTKAHDHRAVIPVRLSLVTAWSCNSTLSPINNAAETCGRLVAVRQ